MGDTFTDMKNYFALLLVMISAISFAQNEFNQEELLNPKNNWESIVSSFDIDEVERYDTLSSKDDKAQYLCAIPNSLRSSEYDFFNSWLEIRDTVMVKEISIVFSKYPIRKKGYTMNQKLLCNRLIHLFELDEDLNSDAIQWNIKLQTACLNDDEANQLFHGVVIHYDLPKSKKATVLKTKSPIIADGANVGRGANLSDIISKGSLNDSILELVKDESIEEKEKILINYYTSESKKEKDNHVVTKGYLKDRDKELKSFLRMYKGMSDDVVPTVLDRNPQWENVLVVSDWTGSMYGYGAQVLDWHIENFDRSEIACFTLFNDGDFKVIKKVGSTEGIYHEKADNMRNLLALYKMVMLKGGGGDGPENDLEAVLEGMENFPEHKDIILIADNNACVRDMALLENIDKPVHVILCGYNKKIGVNPQYMEIAYATGGSIHTIEEDIENMTLNLSDSTIVGGNIKLGIAPCYGSWYKKKILRGIEYNSLKKARKDRKDVVNLVLNNKGYSHLPHLVPRMKSLEFISLAENEIKHLPNKLYKLPVLHHLDLSKNKIKKISPKISQLKFLLTLNLSLNKLEEVPRELFQLGQLESLDLSHNYIKKIPRLRRNKKLEYLNLSFNSIKEIPKGIGDFKELKELNLSSNKLTELPESITKLKELRVLNLAENDLTKLPKRILRLRNLEVLILSGNNLDREYVDKLTRSLPNLQIVY